MKGKHCKLCLVNRPSCKCLACVKDDDEVGQSLRDGCCREHQVEEGARTCPIKACPDFKPETEEEE